MAVVVPSIQPAFERDMNVKAAFDELEEKVGKLRKALGGEREKAGAAIQSIVRRRKNPRLCGESIQGLLLPDSRWREVSRVSKAFAAFP